MRVLTRIITSLSQVFQFSLTGFYQNIFHFITYTPLQFQHHVYITSYRFVLVFLELNLTVNSTTQHLSWITSNPNVPRTPKQVTQHGLGVFSRFDSDTIYVYFHNMKDLGGQCHVRVPTRIITSLSLKYSSSLSPVFIRISFILQFPLPVTDQYQSIQNLT